MAADVPHTLGAGQRAGDRAGHEDVGASRRRARPRALEHGDLADTSYIASARKSVLSMLYGRYVENGTIRLNESLAEIGNDDRSRLLPPGRTATVERLLGTRSGVYHPASNPGDALVMAPPRGSQNTGTYNPYSNWGFNAPGTIFEVKTGRTAGHPRILGTP